MQKKEIIKIIILESIKGKDADAPLFEYLDPILQDILSGFKRNGISMEDESSFKTCELFFDVMPLFNYMALAEKWAGHIGSTADKVKKDFVEAYKAIFIEYLYKKYFEEKEK